MRHKERIELIKESIAKLATGLLQTVDIVDYAPETAYTRLAAAGHSIKVIKIDLDHAIENWGEEE